MRSFSAKGSPIWTLGRDSSAPSPSVREARTDTPPMPSRPVRAPIRRSRFPSPSARARTSLSARATPTHMTLTVGLALWHSANAISPPTVGTPMQLP